MNIYKESILKNNLKIITSENPHSDVILISIWIKAGGRYGNEYQQGYAHFLEHMMLKGSRKYPSILEFSKTKDRIGAKSDGLTSIDRVCFYIQVTKNHLEQMFELLADMILNPIMDPIVLENEKQVILQELYRSNDDNIQHIWRFSVENAFSGHPLSRNNLGTELSISSVSVDAIKDYYRTYFATDRSAIIVSGGVEHDKVLKLINKFFNNWNIKSKTTQNIEFPAIKNGLFFRKAPIKQTFISFSFVNHKTTLKESLVLDVIATYLAYGTSSFLYQILRHEKGLVYGVHASNNDYGDANLFYIRTATTHPKEVIDLVSGKIQKLEDYFAESIFEELKEQQINTLLMGINDIRGDLNFMGQCWKIYNKLIKPVELIEEIKGLKYVDFIEVKNKYLNRNNLCISAIGEKNPFDKKQ